MEKNIFLTFDIEWASDGILEDFYDLLCEMDIAATLCVTHHTKFLDIFRKDDRIELAVHPNYNALMDMSDRERAYEKVIDDMKEIVPEAVTVRAHSLLTSSRLSTAYAQRGFKYNLDLFYPPKRNDHISCFLDPMGIVKIPFLFEDDLYMLLRQKEEIGYYLGDAFSAPRIFNFHPIHLFLNTDHMDRYEKARPYFHDFEKLKECRNTQHSGIRNLFRELIDTAKAEGYTFKKIIDGNWEA